MFDDESVEVHEFTYPIRLPPGWDGKGNIVIVFEKPDGTAEYLTFPCAQVRKLVRFVDNGQDTITIREIRVVSECHRDAREEILNIILLRKNP
ncbi:MAG: hypothetical protein WCO84_02865 [bacterium]